MEPLLLAVVSALVGAALVALWSVASLRRPAEGIQVLRLWRLPIPRLGVPHFAVLRLSEARHKELQDNPEKFFNDYKIFPVAVREARCATPLTRKPDAHRLEYPGWLVGAPHWPDSAVLCASFELWWPMSGRGPMARA